MLNFLDDSKLGGRKMAKRPAAESLSADDIFDQLHGAFDSSLVFTGLIKRADDSKSVMLSAGADCETWKAVPTSIIERVQFITHLECRGQTYSLVHVFLKRPITDEGRGFASVAQLHRAAKAKPAAARSNAPAQMASANIALAPAPGGSCPDGYSWVWDMARGQWICAKD
jgi:hypothetical protein